VFTSSIYVLKLVHTPNCCVEDLGMSFRRAPPKTNSNIAAYDPSYFTTSPMTASQAPFYHQYNGLPRTSSPYCYYSNVPMTAMETPFDYSNNGGAPYTSAQGDFIPQTSLNWQCIPFPSQWEHMDAVPDYAQPVVKAVGQTASVLGWAAAGGALEHYAYKALKPKK
jgi:hypothetical protein